MKKMLFTLLIIIVILIVVLIFAKNIVAKTAMTAGVKMMTGLTLEMADINIGILNTLIGIKDLKLHNPPEFVDKIMVDMPEIFVNYNLNAFLNKKVHLEELRLNLSEFLVVKNKEGKLNLDALKPVQTAQKETEKKEPPKEKAKQPEMQIDVLQLKIGKVIYKDYTQGDKPKVREFNVNIDERYENITDPQALGRLIVLKALTNTTISSLANFDLGPLTSGLSESLKSAAGLVSEQAGKLVDVSKDLGQKTAQTAEEAVKKTTETLKKILPFGQKKE